MARRASSRECRAAAALAAAAAVGSTAPAASAPLPPPLPPSGGAGFLSMSGTTMIDADGAPVRLTGVNWFGFETGNRVVHGLWSRDYRSMLHQVRDLGFNALRIPWSNAILEAGSAPTGITFSGSDPYDGVSPMNQPLQGKTSLQVLDLIIGEAGRLGLKIILDNHSRKPDDFIAEGLWVPARLPGEPLDRGLEDDGGALPERPDRGRVGPAQTSPTPRRSWGGDPPPTSPPPPSARPQRSTRSIRT